MTKAREAIGDEIVSKIDVSASKTCATIYTSIGAVMSAISNIEGGVRAASAMKALSTLAAHLCNSLPNDRARADAAHDFLSTFASCFLANEQSPVISSFIPGKDESLREAANAHLGKKMN